MFLFHSSRLYFQKHTDMLKFITVLVVNQFFMTNVSHNKFVFHCDVLSFAWINILFNRDLSFYVYNHFHFFLFSCIIHVHVFHQLYSVLTININRTFKINLETDKTKIFSNQYMQCYVYNHLKKEFILYSYVLNTNI